MPKGFTCYILRKPKGILWKERDKSSCTFYFWKKGELVEHVYFTAIYRCDQGSKDVISLADAVLDKVKHDEPNLRSLYAKSDNAGCYQGNLSAESIYQLCHRKGIKLLHYDYNEPCCRKDQCDRERKQSLEEAMLIQEKIC